MEYGTIILIPLVHELGHWLAARLFGASLRFYREGFRFLWKFPDVPKWQLRIICLAGFGLELGIAPFMPLPYQVAAVIHFIAYPFYAGESSDWKGVI
jgi:membrane-associated protease RseP (regulator of RpoE activity)